jgi:predicted permease
MTKRKCWQIILCMLIVIGTQISLVVSRGADLKTSLVALSLTTVCGFLIGYVFSKLVDLFRKDKQSSALMEKSV